MELIKLTDILDISNKKLIINDKDYSIVIDGKYYIKLDKWLKDQSIRKINIMCESLYEFFKANNIDVSLSTFNESRERLDSLSFIIKHYFNI